MAQISAFLMHLFGVFSALAVALAVVGIYGVMAYSVTRRTHEIGIRIAVGAGRGKVLLLVLKQALQLALAGVALGIGGAIALTRRITNLLYGVKAIDPLTFAGMSLLLTGVLFGLVPALHSSRIELAASLKEGGRGSQGSRHHTLSSLLVILEVAIALVLLIGAGLLLRSLLILQRVDPGFRLDNILCLTIDLTPSKYPKPRDQASYFQRVIGRVQALAGIESAALSACPPVGQFSMVMSGVEIEGKPSKEEEKSQRITFNVVSSDYFRTMGIALLAGRYFSEADGDGAPGVAIINESFARTYFPNENPVGRQLKTPFQKDEWLTVVGVVHDVREFGLDHQVYPEVYRDYLQAGTQYMTLMARTHGDALGMVPAVRSQVMSVDRDQPAFGIKTMETMLEETLKTRKTNLFLLSIFASFALILASVGIYGVVSYNVSCRTHEVGIRMALGARSAHVVGVIVARAMVHTLIGLAVGVAAAVALTRFLSSLLYAVTATDPLTYAAIALFLSGIALIASYVPSLRAAKVDPIEALRYE